MRLPWFENKQKSKSNFIIVWPSTVLLLHFACFCSNKVASKVLSWLMEKFCCHLPKVIENKGLFSLFTQLLRVCCEEEKDASDFSSNKTGINTKRSLKWFVFKGVEIHLALYLNILGAHVNSWINTNYHMLIYWWTSRTKRALQQNLQVGLKVIKKNTLCSKLKK